MVWAKPVRSLQGPSRPKAGIRTMINPSFSEWTRSQSKPNCSMTRGVKFSTRTSAVCRSRSNISDPSGRDRSKVDAAFAGIGCVEDGAPLPPAVVCRGPGTGETHVVGSRDRFDLYDIGSQTRQGSGGRRTRPPGGAVDDPYVGQRQPPALGVRTHFRTAGAGSRGGGIRPAGPLDRTGVLTEPWGGGERPRGQSCDPIGNTGLEESTGGMRDEDSTGHELLELGHGRAVEEGTRRNPDTGRLFPGSPRWCVGWCTGARQTGTRRACEIALRPEKGRSPPRGRAARS